MFELLIPLIPIIVVIFIIYIFFQFIPVGLWISAIAAGVKVGIFTLVGMRLRRVPPQKIVNALIKATKAGLTISIDKLEAHFLAGGDVDRVIDSLIAAERAGLNLTFEKATAIDLAGRNVLEAVQMSVNPKVIKTPIVAAEAEVTKAIAEALRTGKLGVMDYYNLENIMADTSMRDSISETSKKKENCLLYTSDAADEEDSVDLGG